MAAARAAGHAAATAHMASHVFGASDYTVKAITAAAGHDAPPAKRAWQRAHADPATAELLARVAAVRTSRMTRSPAWATTTWPPT